MYKNIENLSKKIDIKERGMDTAARNTDFSDYEFPHLECSSKNQDKIVYDSHCLVKDLGCFFSYLPLSELNRLVRTVSFCVTEALKRYGYVSIPDLGRFVSVDTTRTRKVSPATGKSLKKAMYFLGREIIFHPSRQQQAVITPKSTQYLKLDSSPSDPFGRLPLFEAWIQDKLHRRRGQLLFQEAFARDFSWKGYSEEYINYLLDKNIVDDTKTPIPHRIAKRLFRQNQIRNAESLRKKAKS